jgi:predicted nucleic acid-binding protein
VSEVVLDASVLVKWFHAAGEDRLDQAGALRGRFESGELRALAPPLIWLEIVNVAARRWSFNQKKLEQLATSLSNLGFELVEPDIAAVARWTARGLTAYDAAYVAVAELTGTKLITDDQQIVAVAPRIAVALGEAIPPGNGERPGD